MRFLFACLLVIQSCPALQAQSREWSDKSGNFKIKATLIAKNDRSVVLERDDQELLIVDFDDLSETDQEFLNRTEGHVSKARTFTMANGLKVTGHVVEFGRRNVVIKRSNRRLYVNDRPFRNLPEVYRIMVPKIVGHFEGREFGDDRELGKFIHQQPRNQKSYTVDGVMFELSNGDRYGIPLFFFSPEDQKTLMPEFKEWLKSEKDVQLRSDLSLRMKTRYAAEQRQRQAELQMRRLSLQLQAYEAGLLWEVEMLPRGTQPGFGYKVIVPGRDSRQATLAAQAKYPGYGIGTIRRLRSRR